MKKEKEEDKLSYMKKKMTLINERISMHEKVKQSEKAIEIAVMKKRKGSAQSVFGSLLRILLRTSSGIWHLAVVTRLERVEDDSDYTKNVQRYWKGAVRDSRRRPCPTKPFQLALGQRGRYGPPLPIMSHTEKQIPAVPVGSADLNQGPTASPMGRGDVIQVLLPNMARTATHKPRTNKDKVT